LFNRPISSFGRFLEIKTFFELVMVSEVLEKQFMLTKNKIILAIKGNNLRVVFFKS